MYENKDYNREVNYVLDLLQRFSPNAKSILDIGCGTGKHLSILASHGYSATGVDLSHDMLNIAKNNYPDIDFFQGDAREFQLPNKFDAIVSLFHVASYQTTNTDLKQYFTNISNHLLNDGIVIFDFWYGPGVLSDPPVTRVKRMKNNSIDVIRIAEPIMYFEENCVDVNYEILVTPIGENKLFRLNEKHTMRYLFYPELKSLLENSGIEILGHFDWLNMNSPTSKSWNSCIVGKKV